MTFVPFAHLVVFQTIFQACFDDSTTPANVNDPFAGSDYYNTTSPVPSDSAYVTRLREIQNEVLLQLEVRKIFLPFRCFASDDGKLFTKLTLFCDVQNLKNLSQEPVVVDCGSAGKFTYE